MCLSTTKGAQFTAPLFLQNTYSLSLLGTNNLVQEIKNKRLINFYAQITYQRQIYFSSKEELKYKSWMV